MKRFLLLSLLLCLAFNGWTQQIFKATTKSVIGFLEYLPEDYHSNSNKYPIVIFLHGVGEKGPNTTDTTVLKQYISLVAKHGPPKHVKNGTKFPFILISPQLKSNYGTWPSAYVMEVLNYCKTYLRIDERRIYITGLSLGGGGTWVAVQDYPELFAATAPVCGGYNSPSKACGIASANLPVWAFHGDKDTVVPLSKSQNMVNAINACVPAPSPKAQLTIYAGVGHNAWDYAYKPDNTLHNPNVYQWLLSFTNTKNFGNNIPVANAGSDKTLYGKNSLTVTGSGSDSDGSIASYSWKKLSGPNVTMSNVTSATLSLTSLNIGSYIFQLQVTDNNGNTDSDYVKVSVYPNTAPVANAGADQTISVSSNYCITGSGTDSDGKIVKYSWKQVSGPISTLSGTSTNILCFSALQSGTFAFQLTVTDDHGATGSDQVNIIVSSSTTPVVSAGSDKLIKLPTTSASVSGTATDKDGTIASYKWSKLSGPACTMSSITSSTLKISSLVSGKYSFRLTATDNSGQSGYDDITVTVDQPPVVNAGSDKNVSLPLSSAVVLQGTASDSDGTISKYQWSKYSGPNIVVSGGTSSTSLTLTTLYAGTYVFKFAATDNLGVTSFDYVQVNVSSVTTSGASYETSDSVEVQNDISFSAKEESFITGWDYEKLKDHELIIWDAVGNRIYTGVWTEEKAHEMALKGLIIYQLRRANQIVKSGKILFR